MNDEKFTKGVWTYSDGADGAVVYCGSDANPISGKGMIFMNEKTHDAHLIAAAPDMYGLLKRLLTGGCLVYGEDIDSVEDLLAKARGES